MAVQRMTVTIDEDLISTYDEKECLSLSLNFLFYQDIDDSIVLLEYPIDKPSHVSQPLHEHLFYSCQYLVEIPLAQLNKSLEFASNAGPSTCDIISIIVIRCCFIEH